MFLVKLDYIIERFVFFKWCVHAGCYFLLSATFKITDFQRWTVEIIIFIEFQQLKINDARFIPPNQNQDLFWIRVFPHH